MAARVGPVSAKFKGSLTLFDVKPPNSYSIAFEGQGGAAGFAKGGRRCASPRKGDQRARLRREGQRRRQAGADRLAPGRRGGQEGGRRLLPQLQREGERARREPWSRGGRAAETAPEPRRAIRTCRRSRTPRSCSFAAGALVFSSSPGRVLRAPWLSSFSAMIRTSPPARRRSCRCTRTRSSSTARCSIRSAAARPGDTGRIGELARARHEEKRGFGPAHSSSRARAFARA